MAGLKRIDPTFLKEKREPRPPFPVVDSTLRAAVSESLADAGVAARVEESES